MQPHESTEQPVASQEAPTHTTASEQAVDQGQQQEATAAAEPGALSGAAVGAGDVPRPHAKAGERDERGAPVANDLIAECMQLSGTLTPADQTRKMNSHDRTKSARQALQDRGGRSTSVLRGVTHHVRTNRWEAHIWEEGKQLYLGGYTNEHMAGLAHDIAAIKCRGTCAITNYELKGSAFDAYKGVVQQITRDDIVAALRAYSRVCTGRPANSSEYRGVTRHQKGKWEARIGTTMGRKYKYLGLFMSEQLAAKAYDAEAVRHRGLKAITNFPLVEYLDCMSPEDAQLCRENNGLPLLPQGPPGSEANGMPMVTASENKRSTASNRPVRNKPMIKTTGPARRCPVRNPRTSEPNPRNDSGASSSDEEEEGEEAEEAEGEGRAKKGGKRARGRSRCSGSTTRSATAVAKRTIAPRAAKRQAQMVVVGLPTLAHPRGRHNNSLDVELDIDHDLVAHGVLEDEQGRWNAHKQHQQALHSDGGGHANPASHHHHYHHLPDLRSEALDHHHNMNDGMANQWPVGGQSMMVDMRAVATTGPATRSFSGSGQAGMDVRMAGQQPASRMSHVAGSTAQHGSESLRRIVECVRQTAGQGLRPLGTRPPGHHYTHAEPTPPLFHSASPALPPWMGMTVESQSVGVQRASSSMQGNSPLPSSSRDIMADMHMNTPPEQHHPHHQQQFQPSQQSRQDQLHVLQAWPARAEAWSDDSIGYQLAHMHHQGGNVPGNDGATHMQASDYGAHSAGGQRLGYSQGSMLSDRSADQQQARSNIPLNQQPIVTSGDARGRPPSSVRLGPEWQLPGSPLPSKASNKSSAALTVPPPSRAVANLLRFDSNISNATLRRTDSPQSRSFLEDRQQSQKHQSRLFQQHANPEHWHVSQCQPASFQTPPQARDRQMVPPAAPLNTSSTVHAAGNNWRKRADDDVGFNDMVGATLSQLMECDGTPRAAWSNLATDPRDGLGGSRLSGILLEVLLASTSNAGTPNAAAAWNGFGGHVSSGAGTQAIGAREALEAAWSAHNSGGGGAMAPPTSRVQHSQSAADLHGRLDMYDQAQLMRHATSSHQLARTSNAVYSTSSASHGQPPTYNAVVDQAGLLTVPSWQVQRQGPLETGDAIAGLEWLLDQGWPSQHSDQQQQQQQQVLQQLHQQHQQHEEHRQQQQIQQLLSEQAQQRQQGPCQATFTSPTLPLETSQTQPAPFAMPTASGRAESMHGERAISHLSAQGSAMRMNPDHVRPAHSHAVDHSVIGAPQEHNMGSGTQPNGSPGNSIGPRAPPASPITAHSTELALDQHPPSINCSRNQTHTNSNVNTIPDHGLAPTASPAASNTTDLVDMLNDSSETPTAAVRALEGDAPPPGLRSWFNNLTQPEDPVRQQPQDTGHHQEQTLSSSGASVTTATTATPLLPSGQASLPHEHTDPAMQKD